MRMIDSFSGELYLLRLEVISVMAKPDFCQLYKTFSFLSQVAGVIYSSLIYNVCFLLGTNLGRFWSGLSFILPVPSAGSDTSVIYNTCSVFFQVKAGPVPVQDKFTEGQCKGKHYCLSVFCFLRSKTWSALYAMLVWQAMCVCPTHFDCAGV